MDKQEDPKDLIGIASLLDLNNEINIQELEKEIIELNNDISKEEKDNVEEYERDMERCMTAWNINSLDAPAPKPTLGGQQNVQIPEFSSNIEIEDNQLKFMTIEEKKQNYVNDVLQDIDVDNNDLEFDIDREKEEDDKNALLEQTDMLRMTLEDDGVDVTNIPKVDKNSSLSDIQNVHKILRLKNDRNRYCSFAEEMILSMAYGVEYLFDGKKEWFGRRPDLVGWNQTLKVKLKRCRYQTSTLVKDIMQEYNMGPTTQLLLEIIPSMFLYSRQKSRASHDSLADDRKYHEAMSHLNSQMN